MKLIYGVKDKPKFGQTIVFAIQQLLAIMAATLVVPIIINSGTGSKMDSAAALFGAGIGTLVYLLFTKFRSPVFLGSSFAFIGSMSAAIGGAASMAAGYAGLIIGAVMAGLVYVVISIIVKLAGTRWIDKLMPACVIGPTVSIIGLSLAKNAIGDLQKSNLEKGSVYVAILCGLITLFVTIVSSTYGKKTLRLIPFIAGILAGYLVATVFYFIGKATNNPALMIIDYSALTNIFSTINVSTFFHLPDFTFLMSLEGLKNINLAYIGTVAVAYVPVAFVVFAEHLADHENLSTVIDQNLIEDPGLCRTLLGDGVGSMAGAFFGGCPNTTYGESVACVAITRNASVSTIITTAILAVIISFLAPFVAFVNTIPSCVMGGVCIALYGFIAVSGLKMLKNVDLNENRNLFVVSTVLVSGIGGLAVTFGKITLTTTACALILGILVNLVVKKADKSNKK